MRSSYLKKRAKHLKVLYKITMKYLQSHICIVAVYIVLCFLESTRYTTNTGLIYFRYSFFILGFQDILLIYISLGTVYFLSDKLKIECVNDLYCLIGHRPYTGKVGRTPLPKLRNGISAVRTCTLDRKLCSTRK